MAIEKHAKSKIQALSYKFLLDSQDRSSEIHSSGTGNVCGRNNIFYPVMIRVRKEISSLKHISTSSGLKQKLKTIAYTNRLVACVKNVETQKGTLAQVCFKSSWNLAKSWHSCHRAGASVFINEVEAKKYISLETIRLFFSLWLLFWLRIILFLVIFPYFKKEE